MAVLGPNMDYELLHHCADARGAKWAERLGASLPHVRALLPPLDPDVWRTPFWWRSAMPSALPVLRSRHPRRATASAT